MAGNRGAHSRPEGQMRPNQQQVAGQQARPGQSSKQAYEEAYRRYVNEHGTSQRRHAAGASQQRQALGATQQRNPVGATRQGNHAQGRGGMQRDAFAPGTTQQVHRGQAPSGYSPAMAGSGRQFQGAHGAHNWNGVPAKKKHTVRNVVIVLLVVLIVVGGFAGFTGYTLYNSAMTVRGEAQAVMADMAGLKDQLTSNDPSQASTTATSIAKHAKKMKDETSGWAWSIAQAVPVYGGDVKKVRELATVMDDLSKNAVVPLIGELSQVSLANLLNDGAINVDLANRVVSAVDAAAPVIQSAASKLETMGDAKLEQINGPLSRARETLGKLNTLTQFIDGIAPTFSDMLGANGRPRTYLIVAQNNSEIRSTGGFLGSVGPLYLDNGRISLGDFRTIYEIYPQDPAPLTDEELDIFGRHVGWQVADCNFIPDFSRVGEIVKFAWEYNNLGGVDGVIGVDPVFLQRMLEIAGPVTTSNGTVVDGSNAARMLLHDAYYMDPEYQDPFFEEVAALSFAQLMGHLGDISLPQLVDIVNKEMDNRRLQIWMAAENEESAIEMLGADGKLSHDASAPEVGVFFAEESYSKLFWYLKTENVVGAPVDNPDGTKTYPVTSTYWNMLTDEAELSEYMAAHNADLARQPGEMVCWLMLSAPAGGSISDVVCTQGEFVPEGTHYREEASYVSGTMTQTSFQGLDFWYGLTRTPEGGTFSLSYNVTVPATAVDALKVVSTPNAQAVAGW